jgi:hypothetical protein
VGFGTGQWVLILLASVFVSSALALDRVPARFCDGLVAGLAYSEDWVGDRPLLERILEERGIPDVRSYGDVRPLLAYLDVRETPTFLALPTEERRHAALEACRAMAKIPAKIRELNFRAGFALFLVVDNVVEHPRMGAYANRRPRGHPRGTTWKVIAGAGMSGEAPGAVVATRKLAPGVHHGATNLLLHEVGHNVDAAWAQLHMPKPRTARERWEQWRHGRKLSATREWRALHRRHVWPSHYEQRYPEEAFAEAFARYFHSAETREHFRKHQPDAFLWFERWVESYDGPPPLDPP